MGDAKDVVAEIAWETARQVVDLIRWDREEQRADAFVEILLVIDRGFERLAAARRKAYSRSAGEPGKN